MVRSPLTLLKRRGAVALPRTVARTLPLTLRPEASPEAVSRTTSPLTELKSARPVSAVPETSPLTDVSSTVPVSPVAETLPLTAAPWKFTPAGTRTVKSTSTSLWPRMWFSLSPCSQLLPLPG